MSDAAWPLQQAVYGALSANGVLTSGGSAVPVYDDVPASAAEPYVVIGDLQTLDAGTKTTDDEEHLLDIHVWSAYRGRKEVREIMGQIKAALHDQSLSVTGQALVYFQFREAQDFLDADGVTRHGVVSFRAMTTPT